MSSAHSKTLCVVFTFWQWRITWYFRFQRRQMWGWLSRDAVPCSLVEISNLSNVLTASIIRAIARSTIESQINFYQTTRCNVPQDRHLLTRHHSICSYTPKWSLRVRWAASMTDVSNVVTKCSWSLNLGCPVKIRNSRKCFLPPKAAVEWLTLQRRVREAPGTNLGPETGCPEGFRDFHQSIHENARIEP
jgi:hypothetical protein